MNKSEKKAILALALYHLEAINTINNGLNPKVEVHYGVLRSLVHYGFIQDFDYGKGILISDTWLSKQ